MSAAVVPTTDTPTPQGFVRARAEAGATVHADDAAAHRGMAGFEHEAVDHSVGEYVRGMAHTNGVVSLWAMLKRGYQGTCRHTSRKHQGRCANEFAGRRDERPRDAVDQMAAMAQGMIGKHLRYDDLIA